MARKLFCEISPLTYKISTKRLIMQRNLSDFIHHTNFAQTKSEAVLPYLVAKHNSLIERKLGDVNMQLQKNKRVNLSLALPFVSHILIKPKQTFSFWHLVGSVTLEKGYQIGLTVGRYGPDEGIGGGCVNLRI